MLVADSYTEQDLTTFLTNHHQSRQKQNMETVPMNSDDEVTTSMTLPSSSSSPPPALLSAVAKGITSLASIRGLPRMTHLLSLNLHLNAIHRIESHCLSPLVNLVELNLSGNQIAKIEGISPHLKNLRILDLSCNRLERVEGLSGLVHLRKVLLASNRISSLVGFAEICGSGQVRPSLSLFRDSEFNNNRHQQQLQNNKNNAKIGNCAIPAISNRKTSMLGLRDVNVPTASNSSYSIVSKSSSVTAELEFIDLRNNCLDNLLEFKYLASLSHLKQLKIKNGNNKHEPQLVSAFSQEEQGDNFGFGGDGDDDDEDGDANTSYFSREKKSAANNNNNNNSKSTHRKLNFFDAANSALENPICVAEPDYLFRISEVCPQIMMIDQVAVAFEQHKTVKNRDNNSQKTDEQSSNSKNNVEPSTTIATAVGNVVPPTSNFAQLRHSSEFPLVSATLRYRDEIMRKEQEKKARENPKPDLSDDPILFLNSNKRGASATTLMMNNNTGGGQLARRNSISLINNSNNNNKINESSASIHERQEDHLIPRVSLKVVNRSSQTERSVDEDDDVEKKQQLQQQQQQQQNRKDEEQIQKLQFLLQQHQDQLSENDDTINNLNSEIDRLESKLDEERRDFDRSKQHWELELQRFELGEEKLKLKLQEEIAKSRQELNEHQSTSRDQMTALKAEVERLQFVTRNSAKELEVTQEHLRAQNYHHATQTEKMKKDSQHRIQDLEQRLHKAREEIISEHANGEIDLKHQKRQFDNFLSSQYAIWSLSSEESETRQQLIVAAFASPSAQRCEKEFVSFLVDYSCDLENQIKDLALRELRQQHHDGLGSRNGLRNYLSSPNNKNKSGSQPTFLSTSETSTNVCPKDFPSFIQHSVACGEDKPMSASIIVEKSRWQEMGRRFDSLLFENEEARKTTTDAFNSLLQEKNRCEALEAALSATQEELKASLCQLSTKDHEIDSINSLHEIQMLDLRNELVSQQEKHEHFVQAQSQAAVSSSSTSAEYFVELRDELQTLKKDRDEVERENSSLRKRLNEVEEQLHDRTSELEDCIAEAQEKINEKRNRVSHLEEEREKMLLSLDQGAMQNCELVKRLEGQNLLQLQLRSASDMLRGHIVTITEALEREHSINGDLRQNIGKLERDNVEWKKKYDESRKKMQEVAQMFNSEK